MPHESESGTGKRSAVAWGSQGVRRAIGVKASMCGMPRKAWSVHNFKK